MKYLLIALIGIGAINADPVDEALVLAAQVAGRQVYFSCIAITPVTAEQQAICAGLYTIYNNALRAVNAPLPLVPSLDPSPYVLSQYDVCRYETGHMIFGHLALPFCTTFW
jgi:hypothetical protein